METPQERFQQILEEGIRKSLQLIIGARIPDPEIDQTDRWFCLRSEFPACLNDSDIRGFIERNNFVFNLFLKDSGKNRETILLEQWTFRCQKTAFVDTDFAKSKRHLYSKMVVFIRCLCSFLRNLPAHRLVKQSVAMKKRASLLSSFEMNFDTIENARKYQLGTSPSEFQFCSIPMHVADFSLGVKYRPFCPLSLLLQKRPQDEALNVVKDFSDDRHYHDGDGERNRIPPTPSSYPAPSPALSLSNSQSPSRQNPSSPSSQNPATKHFSSSATPKRGGGGGGGGGGGIPQQIPPPSSPVSIPSSHNKSEGAVSHSLPESRNSSVIAQSPIFVFDNYDMNSSSFQESGRKEVQGQEQQRRGGEEERDVTDKQTDDFFRTSTHETEDQTTTESPSMAGSLESTKSPPFFMAPKVPPIELLGSPPTTSSPSFFPKYFSPFKVGPKTSAFLNTEGTTSQLEDDSRILPSGFTGSTLSPFGSQVLGPSLSTPSVPTYRKNIAGSSYVEEFPFAEAPTEEGDVGEFLSYLNQVPPLSGYDPESSPLSPQNTLPLEDLLRDLNRMQKHFSYSFQGTSSRPTTWGDQKKL